MRNLRIATIVFGPFAVVCLCAVAFAGGTPVEWDKPTIAGDVTWAGDLAVRQNVVVSREGTLRIAPGATVRFEAGKGIGITVLGRLVVEGTPNGEVAFLPDKPVAAGPAWEGIRLTGGRPEGHVLAGFRIEGAREGVSVAETTARLGGGTFARCEVGVRGHQKSSVAADNCVFDGNAAGGVISLGGRGAFSGCRFENIGNVGLAAEKGAVVTVAASSFSRGKTGILSLTDAPFRVERSAFTSLEKGMVARQMGKDSVVRGCRFENDGTAILAVQFCSVEVADCTFRENQVGVDVREFSAPAVRHNRFEGNQAAVSLFRKSHALIEKNVFRHNRNAVVVNYSSYPKISGNNFDRNDMSVRLEEFQSGDWEEREGSSSLAGQEALRRGSRNLRAATSAVAFPKRVVATGNFWGPDADRDPAKGTLGKIWDGRKFGPVRYQGFGEKDYAIDVVDFSEESREPFADAGPRGQDR